MHVTMRWLQPDETALGQEYIHRLWKAGHILSRDPALFAWQFRRGHRPDTLGFLIAHDAGTPVGCVGMIALPCHRYGAPFPGAVMTNLIVDPAIRAAALGLEIMQEAYGALGLVGNIGINPRVARLYKLRGQHILTMPRYTCLAHAPAMEVLFRHSDNADGLSMDQYAACPSLVVPEGAPGYAAAPLGLEDLEAWDQAWTTLFAPRLQGVARDGAYLRWRYFEHPAFRYETSVVRDGRGTIRGLAVIREVPLPEGVTATRILDFLAADEAAGRALTRAVARRVPDTAAYVEYVCLGREWLPLQAMGLSARCAERFSVYSNPPDFKHCTLLAGIQVRLPGVAPQAFVESPDTYLTLADGDQDRPV